MTRLGEIAGSGPAGVDQSARPVERTGRAWIGPHRLTVLVTGVGVALTAILAWTSWSQYDHNEQRLIDLRVKEAGSLVSGSLPAIQTPVASAAALAGATAGDPNEFRTFMTPYVGAGRQFVSASLWAPGADNAPIVVIGSPPALPTSPTEAAAFFGRAVQPSVLHVTGLLAGQNPRLGYAFTNPGAHRGYTAYVESALPTNRRIRIASNSAFADLDYALYVGRSQQPQDLLQASVKHLPMGGRHASAVVPFGDSAFTLVMAPRRPLSGALSQRLPWIIGGFGTLLALGAGLLTERLIRRRQQAERLAERLDRIAAENRRLYAEQRTVAEVLQRSLLPEALPRIAGAETGVLYLPGVEGMHIGGDWYDIIVYDDDHVLFVVGDVSGRGLGSATVMASLRYAVRAYAAQGDPPEVILTKLSVLLSVERSGHFATVLCIFVNLADHEITVANAGHLPPLLMHGGEGDFIENDVGVPIGVSPASYAAVTVAVPPDATLMAFTDGLVERRDESLDVGLKRLRDTAVGAGRLSLDDLLSAVVQGLVGEGVDDDTVVLGLRWRS